MRKFKYSEKQMWSFARKSRSTSKQEFWIKKLYNQKIKIAKRHGETRRVQQLQEWKRGVRTRIRNARLPIRKMNWTIASKQEIEAMIFGAKIGKQGDILILDDNGQKIIAYAGTEIYDEIVEGKIGTFGVKWEDIDPDDLKVE